MKVLVTAAALLSAGSLLPSEAVVGGGLVPQGDLPWVAAIYTGDAAPSGQFCGGTLIAPSIVVTAGHCVRFLRGQTEVPLMPTVYNVAAAIPGDPLASQDPAAIRLRVLLGDVRLSGSQGERILVASVYPYPDRDLDTVPDMDIAVLVLQHPSAIAPIRYLRPGDPAALDAPGVAATIVGWGATGESDSGSNSLMEAVVPIISDASCRQSYSAMVPGIEVCAGYPQGGTDTCNGDSGGPLVVPSPGGWKLVGATSWGLGCARPNKPGVYAEMRAAAAFIDTFIA